MNDSLSPSVQLRLEKLCTRFEAAWQAAGSEGAPPRIDDYVGGVAEPERQALLWELLLLDLHYRRRRGECPDPADYAAHFPDDNGLIHAALAAAKRVSPDSRRTTTLPDPVPIDAAASPTQDAAADRTHPTIPGYRVLSELGKGGMGEVVRGHDLHLGRDLAVKVLLKKYQGEPHLVQRFLAEARIHARLQHPGIVPLHELGELPDRRPYFTMKLVEGRTLAELLKERADPGRELPRFLGIFEQVCQALAYAHSKGVIHRDLKPANVMVGAFGEVQVMDWGLAKVLDRDGPVGAVTLKPTENGEAEWQSQPGTVMGTYAYMAPEQARGEVGSLDERCDVFGLGGILCEILSGRPPFTGADRDELAAQARAGDHAEAFAALDASGADADLVRLAKHCLAAEASARPADGGAVAAGMTAYLAEVQERLRRAELERTAAEARAQEAKATAAAERRARRRTRALAAAVLALVAVGAVGTIVVQDQVGKRRADQARHDGEQRRLVESALDKATAMREQLRFREAAAMLAQGWKALGDGGPDDLRRRLDVAEAELGLVKRLDTVRQHLATWVEGHFDKQTAAREYAAAFKDAGLGEVGDDEEAVAKRIRASGMAGPLVAALDDWGSVAQERVTGLWLLGVARRAAPDSWGDRFRDPTTLRDGQALQALADDALRDGGAKLAQLSPQVLARLGAHLLHRGFDSVPLLRAAQHRYPNDFWLNLLLNSALDEAKHYEEAAGYGRVAVALRPDAAAAHNNLGTTLSETGDLDGAIAECRTAIELDPQFAWAYSNLGIALYAKKDLVGAIDAYKKAIDIDPNAAPAHNNLGNALSDKKDLGEAIAEFHTAIDLDPRYGRAHYNLGLALGDKGDLVGAIDAYKKAIDLDPKYAPAHYALGTALRAKKDLVGAIDAYKKAIDIDPRYAHAHYNLGLALGHKGDMDGAIAAYRQAIDLDPKLAMAHNNIGVALRHKKDLYGAIAEFRTAIHLDPKLAPAHTNLGLALAANGDLEWAIREHHTAIGLDPKHALAHTNLGIALAAKGQRDEAIREHRTAIDLDPKLALAHYNLGVDLYAKGQRDEAIREFRIAIDLDAMHAPAHTNLGHALYAKGDVEWAIREYRTAIDLDPKLAQAHHNLGVALYDKGEMDGAIAEYRTAIYIDPKYARAHYNLGVALDAKGQRDEAIREFRIAINIDLKYTSAHYNLGNALGAKGDMDRAIAEYRMAIYIDGDQPEVHCNLGHALRNQGRFTEALEELSRGHALGSKRRGWPYRSADWVRQAEQLVDLDRKLPAVLVGQAEPADAAEWLTLAELCRRYKRLHAAAARLYAGAFAADSRPAADLRQQHRYSAACSAILAAAGQGEDAKHLPDKVRLTLRRQALTWLRADLALWAQVAERAEAPAKQQVRQVMQHWQQNTDLASLRDKAALDQLPEDERQHWCRLWDDVPALLRKVEEKREPPATK